MNSETIHKDSSMALSIVVPDEDPFCTVDYMSGLSADDNSVDGVQPETYFAKRSKSNRYRSPSLMRRRMQNTDKRNPLEICDRLYHEAKDKELKRARMVRDKIDQENQIQSRKLQLATERSYTPMRTRETNGNIHDRLYKLAKKNMDLQKSEETEEMVSSFNKSVAISPKDLKEVSGRLYDRSLRLQEEGKKRREDIKKKHAPRAPTPSRRIPLSQASAMYERGLSHIAKTEKKIEGILNSPRESTFPKMKTQISKSTSRARSQTPSRRSSDRCATPSRRQATPCSREAVEVMNTYMKNTPREKQKLPPTSLRTRNQSPDLRTSADNH